MAQFQSPSSFARFSTELRLKHRYIRTSESEDFLRAVIATCKARVLDFSAEKSFWRAQRGNCWTTSPDERFRHPEPYGIDRMKPLKQSAREGRVNPKGIPCLYLSTTPETAMSEMRPGMDEMLSLAQFKIVRELKVIDCSLFHDRSTTLTTLKQIGGASLEEEQISIAVWASIDRAFTKPVTSTDNVADYAATQTIADMFRSVGYDGIYYKSAGAIKFAIRF